MINFVSKNKYDVYDLKEVIRLLRSPGGCPWDIEQTHESIRRNFIEEAYEAVEAINEKSTEHLCEELGDVLMQVVFHAQIEDELGSFDLDDVADMECRKMIYRHPHVFGSMELGTSAEVLDAWEELKKAEKNQETVTDAMNSVAGNLPALWRADKVQGKGIKAGYRWPDTGDALAKLRSEVDELEEALELGDNGAILEELGDVIFAAVTIGRMHELDPEEALNNSCDKYIHRFSCVEKAVLDSGREIKDLTLRELEELYAKAKAETN